MRPSAHDRAHELLHQMVGPDASFRDGQLDAIVASVDERARTLIKTGRPRGPPRRTRIWPRRHPRCTREGFAGVLVRAIAIVTRDPNIMIQPIDLPLAALAPSPLLFTHQSPLHGQSHVSRVLVHAFRLVEATGWIEEAPRLWAAVYLHDLARTHDGTCHRHGADAMKKFDTLPGVRTLFARGGVRNGGLREHPYRRRPSLHLEGTGPRACALAADITVEGRRRARPRPPRRPGSPLLAQRRSAVDGLLCPGTVRCDGRDRANGRRSLRRAVARSCQDLAIPLTRRRPGRAPYAATRTYR